MNWNLRHYQTPFVYSVLVHSALFGSMIFFSLPSNIVRMTPGDDTGFGVTLLSGTPGGGAGGTGGGGGAAGGGGDDGDEGGPEASEPEPEPEPEPAKPSKPAPEKEALTVSEPEPAPKPKVVESKPAPKPEPKVEVKRETKSIPKPDPKAVAVETKKVEKVKEVAKKPEPVDKPSSKATSTKDSKSEAKQVATQQEKPTPKPTMTLEQFRDLQRAHGINGQGSHPTIPGKGGGKSSSLAKSIPGASRGPGSGPGTGSARSTGTGTGTTNGGPGAGSGNGGGRGVGNGAGEGSGGTGTLALGGMGADWTGSGLPSYYAKQALQKVGRFFTVPPTEQRQSEALVVLTIQGNGKISNARISKSCGDSKLDGYALKALEAAQNFAPLPDDFRAPSIEVEISFSFAP